ncbi:hypothetical protein DYB28_007394, partial [Aphanomyces astaci]
LVYLMASVASVIHRVDPFFLALLRTRQRRFQESVDLCTDILDQNPYDQCRSLTQQTYMDDSEMEEDGAADLLLDDNVMAHMPRPGTSLSRPMTRSSNAAGDQSFRPMSSSGRPLSGFARPGTSSRPGSGMSIDQAMQGSRPGTSRPPTSLGRQVRLGTASMQNRDDGGVFINPDRLDFKRYATRPPIAKALVDYLLYHDHNPKKALELAAEATVAADYKDWWWKARLGKCYYQLGLLREAEKQFDSSLRNQPMVVTYLELAKVYLKLDQPNTALELYAKAKEAFPGDVHVLVGIARVYDMLNDSDHAVEAYKEYDLTLSCFERALALASDDNMADVWYNIGQVAVGIGDLGLAYQAFKIAVSVDSNHAESYNNLGVLELRKGNVDQARAHFQFADGLATFMFEPTYNRALLAYKIGDFQDAYAKVSKALQVYPEHADSVELKRQLEAFLTMI